MVSSSARERFQARVGDYYECTSKIEIVLEPANDTARASTALKGIEQTHLPGIRVILVMTDVRSQAFADVNVPEFTGASKFHRFVAFPSYLPHKFLHFCWDGRMTAFFQLFSKVSWIFFWEFFKILSSSSPTMVLSKKTIRNASSNSEWESHWGTVEAREHGGEILQ